MAGQLALFVYGTLRPGRAAAGLLGPLERSLPGVLARARLYDTGLGWPIAAAGESDELVIGDVVWPDLGGRPPSELLGRLDAYEECDLGRPESSLYERVEARVVAAASGEVRAQVYLSSPDRLLAHYPSAQLRHLEDGRWPTDPI